MLNPFKSFPLESSELLSALHSHNDLSLITDAQGVVKQVLSGEAFIAHHGSPNLNDLFLEQLINPDDRQKFNPSKDGGLRKFQARLHQRDGKQVWMLWSVTRLPKSDYLYITANDITSIIANKKPTTHSEEKLQRVLSDGKIGYWEVTFATGELFISDNIREWWGLSPDQVPTNDFLFEVLHPDDRPEMIKSQKFIVETRQPHELIHRARKPDGSYIWVQGIGHPMLDEEGELIGLMGTSMDITQKVELEIAIRNHQAKMLTSSRLSAIGEMAASMAHEINNPLTIIQLHTQELKEQISKGILSLESIQDKTERISQTILRISRIIRSLRTLSRDGQEDPSEPVSIRRIVEETLEICRQKFLNGNIQLRLHFPEGDLMVRARPTQISQVLLNLLNNAYDAIEKAEDRWIELRLESNESSVEIRIKDSGHGIPKELHEKIFNPFFTTKDPTKGTGIGLSVSRSIVASHLGTLEVNPDSGHTEFVIELPKLKPEINPPLK